MKKITLLLLLIPLFSIAQVEVDHFEITPDGVNGYVVKEYPGKSSAELFNAAKRWAEYTINKAEEANKSVIENEYLDYTIIFPAALPNNIEGSNSGYDAKLKVEFRFKENKIRYDVNLLNVMDAAYTPFSLKGGFLTWSFYKNNGEAKSNMNNAIAGLNELSNRIITEVENYIENKSKNNDW